MSDMSVKGIVWDKISLNAANIAFMRRLEKFDCAVVMDEQGCDKNGKAHMAILNTVLEKEKPSVLLITTEKLMYAWYQSLLNGIGADFKFITANTDSINYYSPKLSNLYITCDKAGENPIFKKFEEADAVWDLVIIDGGLSRDGINTDLILNTFNIKAKKLAVFAAYVGPEPGAAEKLSKLPEKFLANRTRAEFFTQNRPDESIVNSMLNTPFIRFYGPDDIAEPSVRIIEYSVNEEISRAKSEQASAPIYCYGGNVFEELTLDMRKLYNYNKYDDETVAGLRGFDSKLNAYLDEISTLLEDPETRVITYFSSEKTLGYIYKVLSSSLIGLKNVTAIKKSKLYSLDDTNKGFEADRSKDIRIVLSLDDQNEQYDQIDTITHVINYELPNNPLTLHRRFRQGGKNGFSNPQFIIFRDTNDQFDGRMISRVIALNINSGFCHSIPGRNIFLYVQGLEKILADILWELNEAENFNNTKLNALSSKYNLRTDSNKAKNILCRKRNMIKSAFGISPDITDKNAFEGVVRNKLDEIRKGFCFYDEKGCFVPFSPDSGTDHEIISNDELENEPSVKLRDKARNVLTQCGELGQLLSLLEQVEEKDKEYVYYCAWRFLADNCNYKKNYNAFLKEVFEEVI